MKYLNVLFVLLLAACGSIPETHYYVLSSPNLIDLRSADESRGAEVVGVGRISFPDYLKQHGLVMQTDDHQIRAANYHLWGEPLEQGIRRVLFRHLSEAMPDFRIESRRANETQFDYRLDIELESFHGTAHGLVVLHGRWTVYAVEDRRRLASESFSFDRTLTDSGYQAMVEAQAGLLADLSRSLSTSVAVAIVDDEDTADAQRLSVRKSDLVR